MKTAIMTALLILLAICTVDAKITLPQAGEFRLENGLTVQVVEKHTLPLFSVRLIVRGGSILDPPGKEGLANLCSEMLMRGTTTRTDKQIVAEISLGGGSLYTSCDRDKAGFTGEFLTEQGEKGLELMGDMLVNSRLAPEEVDKIKTRIVAGLQGDLEDPSAVAERFVNAGILGKSAYAHLPAGTITAVNGLTRQDVVDFIAAHYTPDNAVLIVCGDITPATVETWAQKHLSGWRGRAAAAGVENPFAVQKGKEVLLLDKTDATQTQIRIGNVGISRKDPDYIPLELARTILGGSFTSRLVNEIRVNRGLSYNVRCNAPRFAPGGMVYISTFTKNASVSEVVDIIMNESRRMQTEPVPDSELIGAINYRCGLYPLSFETSDNIANVFANLWLYGENKAEYEAFQEQMRQVTAQQVIDVSRKYFPFENYRLILVGKAEEVKAQAEKFGTVTVQPIATE